MYSSCRHDFKDHYPPRTLQEALKCICWGPTLSTSVYLLLMASIVPSIHITVWWFRFVCIYDCNHDRICLGLFALVYTCTLYEDIILPNTYYTYQVGLQAPWLLIIQIKHLFLILCPGPDDFASLRILLSTWCPVICIFLNKNRWDSVPLVG